jgi:Flp pilus assembly protein TadG
MSIGAVVEMNWKSRKVKALLKRFSRDKKGASAVVFGITLPVLVGFLGLGTEVGYWYLEHRQLQSAADMAAMAAAFELRDDADATKAHYAANKEAERNGFNSAGGAIVVNTPATSGSYVAGRSAEVELTESKPRLFSALFQEGDMQIRTRAVATSTPEGSACVLALDEFAEGAITVIGSANITLTGCDVHSNSGHLTRAGIVTGSAEIITGCFGASGGVDATDGLTLTDCPPQLGVGGGTVADPYAYLGDVPLNPTACSTVPGGPPSAHRYLTAGRYCGGLALRGPATFDDGVYIVDGGDFQLNAQADVFGENVTFILTNGALLSFNGGAHIDLSAPTTGEWAGILIYQDPNADPSGTLYVNGDSTSQFQGAIYASSQTVQFNGNGTTTSSGCTHVVGRIVHLSGSASFGNDCSGTGTTDIKRPGAVVLVE